MILTNSSDIVVNLLPGDANILITYKIYSNCIEIIDFKRTKIKEDNNNVN